MIYSILSQVLCQCIGRDEFVGPYGAGWPYDDFGPFDGLPPYFDFMPFEEFGLGAAWPAMGWGTGIGPFPSGVTAGFGGGLVVTSTSPIAPTGLIVTSENAIEGVVSVAGQLPFLGAVVTDGAFATAGAGTVSYDCGDGALGMIAEAPIAPIAPIVPAFGYAGGPDPLGYAGVAPYGQWGCGCMY